MNKTTKFCFDPINSNKLSKLIVDRIVDLLKKGQFEVGDRLPPERVLAEQLKVSRTPLREALSALEILGLIECRTGQGTFIKDIDFDRSLEKKVKKILEQNESPYEIIVARKTLEPVAAELAAANASQEDIDKMRSYLDKMEEMLREKNTFDMENDGQFHVSIARASGNSVFYKLVSELLDFTRQALWHQMRDRMKAIPVNAQRYHREHCEIFEAIRAGDRTSAREKMSQHILNVEKDVIESEEYY